MYSYGDKEEYGEPLATPSARWHLPFILILTCWHLMRQGIAVFVLTEYPS